MAVNIPIIVPIDIRHSSFSTDDGAIIRAMRRSGGFVARPCTQRLQSM
jgi:hypothetical protein